MQLEHCLAEEIYTSGLEMYTGAGIPSKFGGCLGGPSFNGPVSFKAPSAPGMSIGGPRPFIAPSSLKLVGTGNSFKIFGGPGAPLLRYDLKSHHGLPEKHLQYGENFYTGRHGDEAADIVAEIIRKNYKIKLPEIKL